MKENDLWHNNYNVTREAWNVVLDKYGPDPLSTAKPGFTNSEAICNSPAAFSCENSRSRVFWEKFATSPSFLQQIQEDFAKRFYTPGTTLSHESMYNMLCQDALNW